MSHTETGKARTQMSTLLGYTSRKTMTGHVTIDGSPSELFKLRFTTEYEANGVADKLGHGWLAWFNKREQHWQLAHRC